MMTDQDKRLDLASRLGCRQVLDGRVDTGTGERGPGRADWRGAHRLHRLDIRYTGKFGFPFMIAVCDLDRIGILALFKLRIENDGETGFAEACTPVEWIAGLRLMEELPI